MKPTQAPLTERRLDGMRQTVDLFHRVQNGGPPTGPRAAYLADVPALLNEVERLSDQLSDCWLVLDALAREAHRGSYGLAAERLLRKHQAPGWKTPRLQPEDEAQGDPA